MLFEHLIYSLCLTITLGMVGSAEVQLDTKSTAEPSKELVREDRSSVGHDIFRNSLETEYEVEHGSEMFRGEAFFPESQEMGHLG
jgi:hypothetical protein